MRACSPWPVATELQLDPDLAKGHAHEVAHGSGTAGGDHVVIGLGLLEDEMHGIHVVARVAPERRRLGLGNGLDLSEELARRSLEDPGDLREPEDPDGLEHSQDADGIHVGGVLGAFEGDGDVALRCQVVDLVQLSLPHDADDVRTVAQVSVVEEEPDFRGVRVGVEAVDPLRVEERGASVEAVDHVPLLQQVGSQVRPILSRDTDDERGLRLGTQTTDPL